MSHSRRVACVVFCLGVGLVGGCAQGPGQSTGRIWEVGQSEADAALSAAVEAKLDRTGTKLEFSGIALSDVVQYLRDASNCSIYVKWDALEAVGIEKNAAVNVKLKHVTLRAGLRAVLDDVSGDSHLGFDVRSGVLVISTLDEMSRYIIVRIYDVSDLIPPRALTAGDRVKLRAMVRDALTGSNRLFGPDLRDGETLGQMTIREACRHVEANLNDAIEAYVHFRTERLRDLICATVAPDSWEGSHGTYASMEFLGGKMVVYHTRMAHREIADLLAALREQTAPIPAAKPAPPPERPAQAKREGKWCGVRVSG